MSVELLNLSMETKSVLRHLTNAIVALSGAAKAAPVYIELPVKHGKSFVRAEDISCVTSNDDGYDVTVILRNGNVADVPGMTYDSVCQKILEATGGRK